MKTLKELYDNNLGAKFINDLMNDCMSIAKEFRAREAEQKKKNPILPSSIKKDYVFDQKDFLGAETIKNESSLYQVKETSITMDSELEICAVWGDTLPDDKSFKKIRNEACQGNLNLKEIVISAEKIGESAFEGCTNLERVKLTGGNVEIGPYAFKNCTSLKSINLENVVSIGYGAFMRCTNLKTVCFTDRQSKVMFYGSCFDGCSSLETVYLPMGVSFYHIKETYMPEKSLFGGCDSLKGIYVPKEEFAWYCDLYIDEYRDKIKPY